MKVKITTTENKTRVESPYHPDFPETARSLGGRWQGDAWVFDARDEARVRELCRSVYGTDGAETPTVTLRVTLAEEGEPEWGDSGRVTDLWIAGRCVARARSRDGGAFLGQGVVVLQGGFGSGGSRKNYALVWRAQTVIEIRDVPTSLAVKATAAAAGVEILDEPEALDAEAISAAADYLAQLGLGTTDALEAIRAELAQRR